MNLSYFHLLFFILKFERTLLASLQSPHSDKSQGLLFGIERGLKEPTQVKKTPATINDRNFESESKKYAIDCASYNFRNCNVLYAFLAFLCIFFYLVYLI